MSALDPGPVCGDPACSRCGDGPEPCYFDSDEGRAAAQLSITAAPPARHEHERHEAQTLFTPAPEPMPGQLSIGDPQPAGPERTEP